MNASLLKYKDGFYSNHLHYLVKCSALDRHLLGSGKLGLTTYRCCRGVFIILACCEFSATAYNVQSASQGLVSVASSFAAASGSIVVRTKGIPDSTQVPSQKGGAGPVKTASVDIGMLVLAVGF
jgi:hypothetical protein